MWRRKLSSGVLFLLSAEYSVVMKNFELKYINCCHNNFLLPCKFSHHPCKNSLQFPPCNLLWRINLVAHIGASEYVGLTVRTLYTAVAEHLDTSFWTVALSTSLPNQNIRAHVFWSQCFLEPSIPAFINNFNILAWVLQQRYVIILESLFIY